MIAQFSYRYGLPLLVLLPPAGAVAADIGLDAFRARWPHDRRLHREKGSSEPAATPANAVAVGAASASGSELTGGEGSAPNGDGGGSERRRDLPGKHAG
jgi:hypothetical protein